MTPGPGSGVAALRFVAVGQHDELARPLLAELAHEYGTRYEKSVAEMHRELVDHPVTEFAPPHGALVIALRDDVPVAGGAFRRVDGQTAELKRIWTAAHSRRRGLGHQVLVELERRILELGYLRIRLTTGWRQPEAVALYLAAGYTPLFDPAAYPIARTAHAFVKDLVAAPRQSDVPAPRTP
ncbi:GNAT family N-acetyltransferase [Williamsia sterculiae]|uniref:Acetyltransferase (GNAT) family protein n=1 Tax=Williamsia sterculiae TaxID=1344003 RepID=A0A1N7CB41_9NOCA|nr:GNAT family N-acetyltransferase [Williamsia sterculiae]SIR60828.1 Acetyltransferase (GNAT) family protein [Williamsia sterculiae]